MKNRMYIFALMVLSLGIIMTLGTSYSLIMNGTISDSSYGFKVANFDVSFNDDTNITVSSIPMSDNDGIKLSKEYTFNIDNNSDYDINYRLDIIETNATNIGEVIHYVYSVNDSEYSDIYTLKDYFTIKQNKVLRTNTTDVYKVKMWLSDEADESYMNKSFSAKITLTATQNEYKYATSVIEKLSTINQDNVININGDYRYNKLNSPNYVWFNCQEGYTKGDNYCEKWRIIGSFMNKSENNKDEYPSLKIIGTNVYEKISYNVGNTNNYDNSYINSYANGYFYDSLNNDTQKLILKARWNIGEVKSNNYEEALEEEKTKTYYAYVGLPNISDYLYLNSESFFMNDNMFFINKTNGNVNVLNKVIINADNLYNYGFVPCLYLRADVSIMSGDGSIDNPYELGIRYPLNY